MVRTHPDPPDHGGIAQLGEHLLCKQGVVGSIPSASTRCLRVAFQAGGFGKRFLLRRAVGSLTIRKKSRCPVQGTEPGIG